MKTLVVLLLLVCVAAGSCKLRIYFSNLFYKYLITVVVFHSLFFKGTRTKVKVNGFEINYIFYSHILFFILFFFSAQKER